MKKIPKNKLEKNVGSGSILSIEIMIILVFFSKKINWEPK